MSVQPITSGNGRKISLDDILARQAAERGLTPLALEPDVLLRRVSEGGWSGLYLGEAFLNVYYMRKRFDFSLGQLIHLDAEGFRLFHQILHMRSIPGWKDETLNAIAQKISDQLNKDKACAINR